MVYARARQKLVIAVYNSLTVTAWVLFAALHIRPFGGGPVQEIYHEFTVTLENRVEARFQATEEVARSGEIIGFQIGSLAGAGPPDRGQTYIVASLDPRGEVIAADYLFAGGPAISLGQISEPGPRGGTGAVRSLAGTNPAAGVEFSEAVPTGAMWRLICCKVNIVGGAANFTPSFFITDGTNTIWQVAAADVVTGAATEIINLLPASGQATKNSGTHSIPIPFDGFMPAGYTIGSSDITADDDYAAPRIWVEEWIAP